MYAHAIESVHEERPGPSADSVHQDVFPHDTGLPSGKGRGTGKLSQVNGVLIAGMRDCVVSCINVEGAQLFLQRTLQWCKELDDAGHVALSLERRRFALEWGLPEV